MPPKFNPIQSRPPIQPLVPMPAPGATKGRGTAWAIEHRFTTRGGEDFDDGWVDRRGRLGSDLVETGTLDRFTATGAPGLHDLEDAVQLLARRVPASDAPVFVIRIYPDPTLGR
jgi:hypothetical protein